MSLSRCSQLLEGSTSSGGGGGRTGRRRSNDGMFDDDDILTEILLRLPMKVKVVCKGVCKRWFRLISSPSFATCVISRWKHPPWDLLYRFEYSAALPPHLLGLQVAFGHYPEFNSHKFKLGSLLSDQKIELLGADNGLILCAKCEGGLFNWQSEYYICNPLTGQLVSLPKLQVHKWVLVGLTVSCHDGITSYKVVRVIYNESSGVSNFEVFSSDVGQWRDTGVSCPDLGLPLFIQQRRYGGVAYKGIIHWLRGGPGGIMAYDPDKNKLRFISLPRDLSSPAHSKLGTSCDHLCYLRKDLCVYFNPQPVRRQEETLAVYVLNNYDTEEWRPALMTTLKIVRAVNQIPSNERFDLMPLAFHPFDMGVVYLTTVFRKIASFNLQTRKLTPLRDISGCSISGSVYQCVLPPLPTPVPQPIWETE